MADENRINGYPEYNDDPSRSHLYKDNKTFEESNKEGFTVNNGVSPEEYELSKGRTFNDVRDPNSNIFRYGLWYDLYSNVEDPTILGFTCEIDDSENSPLFATGPYSASAFISKYSGMPEVGVRDRILERFQKNIKMMFKSQESTVTRSDDYPYVKSHYLESVTGLKTLMKKFIDYKEDHLLFTMHEDVTMFAQYLSQLYNNLSYSYRSGKMIIPENLLRFNLVIKITEIRNFKTVVRELTNDSTPNDAIRKMINVNSSQIQYTLYDCSFDFSESQNHEDSMQMSSIGGSVPSTSKMDFKLYFKNVSRYFKSEIIDDLFGNTNSRTDLNDRNYNPRIFVDSSSFFKVLDSQPDFDLEDKPVDYTINPGQQSLSELDNVNSPTQRDVNRTLQETGAGGNDISEFGKEDSNRVRNLIQREKENLLNSLNRYADARIRDTEQLKQKLINEAREFSEGIKDSVLEDFRRNRGELLNQLLYEIQEDLNIEDVTPKNVYTDDIDFTDRKQIIEDLGTNVYSDIEDFIRNFNNF